MALESNQSGSHNSRLECGVGCLMGSNKCINSIKKNVVGEVESAGN